jgi:hypothetical protein
VQEQNSIKRVLFTSQLNQFRSLPSQSNNANSGVSPLLKHVPTSLRIWWLSTASTTSRAKSWTCASPRSQMVSNNMRSVGQFFASSVHCTLWILVSKQVEQWIFYSKVVRYLYAREDEEWQRQRERKAFSGSLINEGVVSSAVHVWLEGWQAMPCTSVKGKGGTLSFLRQLDAGP